MREPGQGQCGGVLPRAALAALGVPHSWPDCKPPGAAIFLDSNAAAGAALAWRRQRGARMRRGLAWRTRACTRQLGGPRGQPGGALPFGEGAWSQAEVHPAGPRPLEGRKVVLPRLTSFGI